MTRWTCSSVARSCMTTTMAASYVPAASAALLFVGDPLQPAVLVDDALEQPLDGAVVERTLIDVLHVLEHLRFPAGLVEIHPSDFLFVPDGEGALSACAQQTHELLVDLVDAAPQLVEPAHASPFNQRT